MIISLEIRSATNEMAAMPAYVSHLYTQINILCPRFLPSDYSLAHKNLTDLSVSSSATFFLEHWKRKQSEVQYDWDLIGYEDEEVPYRLLVFPLVVAFIDLSISSD